jgi:hypothetical protein
LTLDYRVNAIHLLFRENAHFALGHTMKRWKPRFYLKWLLFIFTVVASYLGLWAATKTSGVNDLRDFGLEYDIAVEDDNVRVPFPLVIEAIENSPHFDYIFPLRSSPSSRMCIRHRYFWFFGYITELSE